MPAARYTNLLNQPLRSQHDAAHSSNQIGPTPRSRSSGLRLCKSELQADVVSPSKQLRNCQDGRVESLEFRHLQLAKAAHLIPLSPPEASGPVGTQVNQYSELMRGQRARVLSTSKCVADVSASVFGSGMPPRKPSFLCSLKIWQQFSIAGIAM